MLSLDPWNDLVMIHNELCCESFLYRHNQSAFIRSTAFIVVSLTKSQNVRSFVHFEAICLRPQRHQKENETTEIIETAPRQNRVEIAVSITKHSDNAIVDQIDGETASESKEDIITSKDL